MAKSKPQSTRVASRLPSLPKQPAPMLMPPTSPAMAPTLRQVIADLKLADPGNSLRDELKTLLGIV